VNYKVKLGVSFKKEFKKLKKKYKSLPQDLSELIPQLESNPNTGTALGKDCYKIRLAITSKGKGKSAGARVISHFYVINDEVILLSIYDKSVKSTITDKEIENLLKELR